MNRLRSLAFSKSSVFKKYKLVKRILLLSLILFSACNPHPPGRNKAPRASFTVDPASGVPPLQVTFDGTASSDPDGEIVAYNWDFGDGQAGAGKTTSDTYSTAGTFTVVLK